MVHHPHPADEQIRSRSGSMNDDRVSHSIINTVSLHADNPPPSTVTCRHTSSYSQARRGWRPTVVSSLSVSSSEFASEYKLNPSRFRRLLTSASFDPYFLIPSLLLLSSNPRAVLVLRVATSTGRRPRPATDRTEPLVLFLPDGPVQAAPPRYLSFARDVNKRQEIP